jgi:hypothetical protein
MTITIGWWVIPLLISLVFLGLIFRRNDQQVGGYWNIDPTPLFRMLWFIPLLLTWVVYLAIVAFTTTFLIFQFVQLE